MAKTKKGSSKFQLQQKYNRTFSEAFKISKVKDLDAGLITIRELSDQYSVSRTAIYNWLYKYSPHQQGGGTKQVVQMQSEAHKTQQLKVRISELEQIIGQKQLEIDFLNKLIELAGEDMGIDLKKSIGQQLSNGSGNVSPKSTK